MDWNRKESQSLEQVLIAVTNWEKWRKSNFSTIPEPIILERAGKVLMLGLKEDSLTITFCNESFKRQFKYYL